MRNNNTIETYIEHDILCFFLEKGLKAFWKNDIKGFYNKEKGFYQKNKSNFIKQGISDISLLYKGSFICIEVKTPSEMTFFDVSPEIANKRYIKSEITGRNVRKCKHAKEQVDFLEEIKNNGGIGFFACSLEQVIERLKDNRIHINTTN